MRPPARRTGAVMTSRSWVRVISETITQRCCQASASTGYFTHWLKKSARMPTTTTVSAASSSTSRIVVARSSSSSEKTFSNWSMTMTASFSPSTGGAMERPSGMISARRGVEIRGSRARPARSNDDLPDPDTPVTTTSREAGDSGADSEPAARIVSTSVPTRSSRPK